MIRYPGIGLAGLAVALVFLACDPYLAPEGSTVQISAPESIVVGRSALIRGVLREESGDPVLDGTEVLFLATVGGFVVDGTAGCPPRAPGIAMRESAHGAVDVRFCGSVAGVAAVSIESGSARAVDSIVIVVPPAVGLPPASVHSMAGPAAPTILVVEDDPALRRTVLRLLEGRHGYQVILASRAEEALARVDLGQQFDLVLSDLNLPDLDGLALYAQLRHRGFAGPFVLTSGDPAEAIAAEKGPIPRDITFLPRPWSIDELTLAVRNAMEGP